MRLIIRGPKKYLGTPCKKCGNTVRYTQNKTCVVCNAERASRWKALNYERLRTLRREHYTKVNAHRRDMRSAKGNEYADSS